MKARGRPPKFGSQILDIPTNEIQPKKRRGRPPRRLKPEESFIPTPPILQTTDRATFRYPAEVKAKAYAAYLNGSTLSDCARVIEHPSPEDSGRTLIETWAQQDKWVRDPGYPGHNYKDEVEKERSRDPKRISDEIDTLCVKMQKVSEHFISRYINDDGIVTIPEEFKTREFADMAAALRMIHETRIKLRKALEPPKEKRTDGLGFLSLIQEAAARRARTMRKDEFRQDREDSNEVAYNEKVATDWKTRGNQGNASTEDGEEGPSENTRTESHQEGPRRRDQNSEGEGLGGEFDLSTTDQPGTLLANIRARLERDLPKTQETPES